MGDDDKAALAAREARLDAREARLDAREARLDVMLRVLPEAVFELDRDGRFLDVHGGSIELLAPQEQILGHRYDEVLREHPLLVDTMAAVLRGAFAGDDEQAVREYAVDFPDGQHFFEARGTAVSPDRALVAVRDVTDARKLLAQLVISDRHRSAFALGGALIHEIGNPLAYLLTSLDALARKVSADADAREILEMAQEGARRLGDITSDFRHLARIDDSPRTADLSATVRRALRFTMPAHGRTDLDLEIPEGLHVAVPQGRLGQVLLNVLSNAAHAIERRRAARIEVRARLEGDRVALEVHDQGEGIAPEHLPRVFDPFFTTDAEGTGLGLWIVRRIVEEHGGTVTCESTVGGGTTLRLTLPTA
ncbi:MAG: PAS domain-containing protein [Deltaproteobacteria bacterium]|nr:PAS domain-containing protein [Deltaproteobacteria bacterium]